MSTQVEERVVGLRFDNKDFEKNVGNSIKTLDKFNASLGNTFQRGASAMTLFASKVKSITLDPLARGAEMSMGKIMALTAALTGVSNVADEVYRKTTALVRSMSSDQVAAGWNKYAEYTQSMQTIMAATKKDGESDEEAMSRVNDEMQKLLWFADETSYSLTDMTSNIGKFTSQGIELETAVKAMQGISLWAASAGQEAGAASRAMYNLSQALGMGHVRLQDWMSIENANMATKEFKELTLEAGVAQKTLKKVGDEYQVIATGEAVSAQNNFRDSLSEGWFTTEVLLDVTQQYNEFAEKVYEEVQRTGNLTSQVIADLKKDGAEALYPIGVKAMEMAQSAITFSQAIDSVKDAVSTQFMRIFQAIFGDYLKAKELWTDFANELWDVFAGPVNLIAQIFERFAELGYMSKITNDFWKAWNDVLDIVNAVKEAFYEAMGFAYDPADESFDNSIIGKTSFYLGQIQKKLHDVRVEFSNFTRRLMANDNLWANLSTFFEGLKSVGNIIKNLFDTIYKRILSNAIGQTGNLVDVLGLVLGKIGATLKEFDQFVKRTDLFNTLIDNFLLAMQSGKKIFDEIVKSAKQIRITIQTSLETLSRTFRTNSKYSSVGMPTALQRLEDGVNDMSYDIENFTDLVITSIDAITVAVRGAVPFFAQLWIWIKDIFRNVKEAGGKVKDWIKKFGDGLSKMFGGMHDSLSDNIKDWYNDFNLADVINKSESFLNFMQRIKEIISFIYGLIHGVPDDLSKLQKPGKKGLSSFSGMFALPLLFMDQADPLVEKINQWMGSKDLGETLEKFAKILARLTPVLFVIGLNIDSIIAIIAFIAYKFKAQSALMNQNLIYATGDFFTDIKYLPASFNTALKAISEIKDPILKHLKDVKQIMNKLFIIGMVIAIVHALAVACMGLIALSFVPWGKLIFITVVVLPLMMGLVVASIGILNSMVEKMEVLETETSKGKSNTKYVRMLGEYILMVAVAFLSVASAFAILASISAKTDVVSANGKESSPFSRAVTAMLVIFGLFSTLIAGETVLANQFQQGTGKTGAIGDLVLKTGISILLIAFAMAKIAKIPEEKLAQAEIAVFALLGVFGAIVFLVENSGMNADVEKAILALGGMCLMISGSLLMACGAMLIIAKKMSVDELVKAGITIAALFVLVSLFLAGATVLANWMANKDDSFKDFIAIGGMLLTLTTILVAFAFSLKALIEANIKWDKMLVISSVLVGVLWGIFAVLIVASKMDEQQVNNMLLIGIALGYIIGMLSIITFTLANSELNAAKLLGIFALISMILILVASIMAFIGVFAYIVTENQYAAIAAGIGVILALILSGVGMIFMGIGLVALGIGMVAMAITEMLKLGDKSEEEMKGVGRKLGAVLESFYVAILDGLGIFIGGILTQIKKMFEKADSIGILGVIKKFLTKVTHTIAAYIEDNHEVIKNSIIYIVEDFVEIVSTVIKEKGPGLLDAVFTFLKDLFTHIKDLADNEGTAALGSLIDLVMNSIDKLLNELTLKAIRLNVLFRTTGLMLVGTWNIIKAALVAGIFATISLILARMVSSANEFGATAVLIVYNFFEGVLNAIIEKTPELLDLIAFTIISIIYAISDTIDKNNEELIDAAEHLLNTLNTAITRWVTEATLPGGKLYNAGLNICRGLIKGLLAGIPVLGSIMTTIANSGVITPFDQRMRINSPSKVMIEKGGNTIDGLKVGMIKSSKSLPGVISDIGGMVGNAFTETFGDPKDILSNFGSGVMGFIQENFLGNLDLSGLQGMLDGFDLNSMMSGMDINSMLGEFANFNPVITPELDTSLIESQFGGIESMFGQEQIQAISGSFSAPMAGMDSVTMQSNFDAMMEKMQSYMDVQAYNAAGNSNVNITLDGDAKKMLKVLKVENLKQTKATNVNQLVTK